ncbi:MAG: Na+:solute symporter, partial [Allomuricauda sp.]
FYKKIQPGGPGWSKVVEEAKDSGIEIDKGEKWTVPSGIGAMLLGVVLIYSLMFSTGHWIYGKTTSAMIMSVIALVSGLLLIRVWNKMKDNIL